MLAGRVGLLGCPAMSGVAARGTFKDLLLLLLLVLTGSVELPRWTGMPSLGLGMMHMAFTAQRMFNV